MTMTDLLEIAGAVVLLMYVHYLISLLFEALAGIRQDLKQVTLAVYSARNDIADAVNRINKSPDDEALREHDAMWELDRLREQNPQ